MFKLSAMPKARSKVVAATFLLRSIFTPIKPLGSVSNSSQAPLLGIIFAPKYLLPAVCWLAKKAPGLLISWEMATLSTPLTTKVPLSVIRGKSVINTSCSFISLVLRLTSFVLTRNGASKESLLRLASKSFLYLDSPSLKS